MSKKLTKRFVDSIAPGEQRQRLWDSELRGFCLQVMPSGVMTYLLVYRNIHGRQRWLTLGRHGEITTEQARGFARQHIAAVARGADPAAERKGKRDAPTVDDVLDRYLAEHVSVRNKPSTAHEFERLIKKRIRPALGTLKVTEVVRADVMKLHHAMRDAPRSANQVQAILSKVFNLSEAWSLRPDGSNPCRHVERYRENSRERFLSPHELKTVGETLHEADLHRLELPSVTNAIRAAALTGCRLGEILGLQWAHIDEEQGTLNLPDSKTGAKSIAIGAIVLAFLKALPRIPDSPWVFPGEDPRAPISRDLIERSWQRLRKRAKLEDVRLHDFRHTVGAFASRLGANAFLIRDKMGHSTVAMTAKYVNRDVSPLRELSDRIESEIGSALAGRRTAEIVPIRK